MTEYDTRAICPHFGICGGCATQDMPYEDELAMKESTVLSLMNDAGLDGFDYLGAVGSPNITGYRNKMEFSFGDEFKDGPLTLGMRKKDRFYEAVNIPECNIMDADFRAAAATCLDFFRGTDERFYRRGRGGRHHGALRHVVVRKGFFTGEMLVNIVTTSALAAPLPVLTERLCGLPLKGSIVGVLHTVNDSSADAVKVGSLSLLHGREHFYERLSGLTFKISPFSFFQTNSAGAEELYATVGLFTGDCSDRSVFDLYCGTGSIAQIVAGNAGSVTGVELIPEAVAAARENAALNNISNCEFIAGDVLKAVDDMPRRPDIIILDPPREGVHPKAIKKISGFGAEKIVYVSCKPSSLARDIQAFSQLGYKADKLRVHDMFPRTAHVETVALLQRR